MSSETDAVFRRELARAVFEVGGPAARPWLEEWRTDSAVGSQAVAYLRALEKEAKHPR